MKEALNVSQRNLENNYLGMPKVGAEVFQYAYKLEKTFFLYTLVVKTKLYTYALSYHSSSSITITKFPSDLFSYDM
jgi:hypothetical protein